MQLCIENLDQAGGCYYNYACAYTDTISWASPSEPLPMIRNPRVAFDLLFGAGKNTADRAARRKANQSILDWITGEVAGLKRELGGADRQRVDKYLEDIRELERRIQAVEARNTSGEARELPEAPAGIPDSFEEHMKLMFDFQVLAFQSDMTRVFSFKTGRDASSRAYPESGTNKGFHPASHHGGREAGDPRLQHDQPLPREHAAVLPRQAQEHAGRRHEPAREDGDHLRLADGRRQPAQPPPLPAPPARPRQRRARRATCTSRRRTARRWPTSMLSLMHRLGLDDMKSFGDSTGEFALSV